MLFVSWSGQNMQKDDGNKVKMHWRETFNPITGQNWRVERKFVSLNLHTIWRAIICDVVTYTERLNTCIIYLSDRPTVLVGRIVFIKEGV